MVFTARVQIFLVLATTLAGCQRSSTAPSAATKDLPTAPTPPFENGPVSAAPGTSVHDYTLPGESVPLRLWIFRVIPAVGSTISPGQKGFIGWTTNGPAGWIVDTRSTYMDGNGRFIDPGTGAVTSDPTDVPCAGWHSSGDAVNSSYSVGRGVTVTDQTPTISDFALDIYVKKANDSTDPPCRLTRTVEHIDWKRAQ